ETLDDWVWQAFKWNGVACGAQGDAKLADIVIAAGIPLIQCKRQHGPAGNAGRLLGQEHRAVRCAESRRHGPARVWLAVDGVADRETVLREIGDGTVQGNSLRFLEIALRRCRYLELIEHKVAVRRAPRPTRRQAAIG